MFQLYIVAAKPVLITPYMCTRKEPVEIDIEVEVTTFLSFPAIISRGKNYCFIF